MMSSVWHAILDNFRPISVWGVDLALFYVVTSGAFGEAWAYPGSYVQVAALGVLLYGTAVYNGSIKVPGCSYPPDAQQPQLLSPMVVRASPALASSQVMKSPLIHGTPLSRRNTMERATLPRVQELPPRLGAVRRGGPAAPRRGRRGGARRTRPGGRGRWCGAAATGSPSPSPPP